MATTSQNELIDKINTKLKNTGFVHNNAKYKLFGWSKDRSRANNENLPLSGDNENNRRCDFIDQQEIIESNYDVSLPLYAVWAERSYTTSFGTLSIKASNISYNQTQTTGTYTIVKTQTYDNGVIKSTETITGTFTASGINPNGGGSGEEEIATQPRNVTISYTYKNNDYSQTATTTIVQGGYTPIFQIKYTNSIHGTIECYQYVNNVLKKLGPVSQNGVYSCSSTRKSFILKAIPTAKSTTKWVAKKGCAYYNKPEYWILHAAAYPNSNGCGSWQTTSEDLYKLDTWHGGSIDGKTATQIEVQGSVVNVQTYSASFVLKPLLTNTMIGTWRKTWTSYTTEQRQVKKLGYRNQYWVPTCWHDTWLKWAQWWRSWNDHTGWCGHGYWSGGQAYYYYVTETVKVSKSNTNTYITENSVTKELSAPYTFSIPATGILTIEGKYGIKAYGCSCTRTGGFCIYKYSPTQKSFDDFLIFDDTLANEDKDFNATFNVKEGEKYQFSAPFSSTAAHIAIYVKSMSLQETTSQVQTQSSDYIRYSNNIVVIDSSETDTSKKSDELSDSSEDKTKLLAVYNNATTNDDYSKVVCKAGKLTKYLDGRPNINNYIVSVKKQSVLQISAAAGDLGYVRKLQILDATNNKVLKTITATGTTWKGDVGDLTSMTCKVYVPEDKKIKINAIWTRVDTQHFEVSLDVKGVQFDKL